MDDLKRRMREEWDKRARENARYYVAQGASESEEAFAKSGESAAGEIVSSVQGILKGNGKVLEIGCGPARILQHIASRFDDACGIDISTEMLRLAEERTQHQKNIHLYHGSGSNLDPIGSNSIDLVYSVITFQHIPAEIVRNYIREAFRVLKSGGVFRFQVFEHRRWKSTMNWALRLHLHRAIECFRGFPDDYWEVKEFPDGRPFTRRELRRMLTSAGFYLVRLDGNSRSVDYWKNYLWVTCSKI